MPALEIDIQQVNKRERYPTYRIQIVRQRHRGSRAKFVASNGFAFTSLSGPMIGGGFNKTNRGMLYLRGTSYSNDTKVLYSRSVGYVEVLKAAVKEYNKAKG